MTPPQENVASDVAGAAILITTAGDESGNNNFNGHPTKVGVGSSNSSSSKSSSSRRSSSPHANNNIAKEQLSLQEEQVAVAETADMIQQQIRSRNYLLLVNVVITFLFVGAALGLGHIQLMVR